MRFWGFPNSDNKLIRKPIKTKKENPALTATMPGT